MRTPRQVGRRRSCRSSAQRWGESPKAFFRLRQAQPQYVHQTLAKWLVQAGLLVRSIERLGTHPVWRGRLRRGQVAPGQEALVVRHVIKDVVGYFGVALPMKEIEVVVQADRITTSFVFENGQPGVLLFGDDHEQWLTDQDK